MTVCFVFSAMIAVFIPATAARNQSDRHSADFLLPPAAVPGAIDVPFVRWTPSQSDQPLPSEDHSYPVSFLCNLGLSALAGFLTMVTVSALQLSPVKHSSKNEHSTPRRHSFPSTPKEPHKYKTQLCLHFQNGNVSMCKYGKRCIFAHSVAELRAPRSLSKTPVSFSTGQNAELNGIECGAWVPSTSSMSRRAGAIQSRSAVDRAQLEEIPANHRATIKKIIQTNDVEALQLLISLPAAQ